MTLTERIRSQCRTVPLALRRLPPAAHGVADYRLIAFEGVPGVGVSVAG